MKKFNVEIHNNCYYENIEANTQEDAINKAWEQFINSKPEISVEEVTIPDFGNAVDIPLTGAIHSVITRCHALEDENSSGECIKYCPLAKVCYKYWVG